MRPFHVADITMFWAPSSGGVRTYLEAKQAWFAREPRLRHSLLVPGDLAVCAGNLHTLPALPLPFGHGYRFPLRTALWVEKLVELAPDLIEAGDPYLLPWAALSAGERLGIPVVGFYHSDLPRLVRARAGGCSQLMLEHYVRALYARFDRVLAPSEVMAQKLRRLGLTQVQVQPLGVDINLFHPAKRDLALRETLGLNDDVHLLVFAGRGAREKNIPLLLDTMVRLGKGYHLHLVGPHMPARLPVNVTTSHGFLDQQEVARILASADALLHAGDRETFGLVVLEAMACGIPVVGVRAGAVAELVTAETGLLAEPGSAEAMALTVRRLFAEEPQARGHAARRRVEQYYAWEQVLPKLLDHYYQLTAIKSAAQRLALHG